MGKVRFGKYLVEVVRDEYVDSPRKEMDNLSTMYCWHKRYSLGDSDKAPDAILRGLLNSLSYDDMVQKINDNMNIRIESEVNDEGYDCHTTYINGKEFSTCFSTEEIYDDIVCDIGDFLSFSEVREFIAKLVPVMRTLYLYDHSGLSISGSTFHGRAQHASWDSGIVGIAIVTAEDLKKNAVTVEQAERAIDSEIETYDMYLNGDVYGVTISEVSKCECCGHNEVEVVDSCFGFYKSGSMAEDMASGFNFEDVDGVDVVKMIEEAIAC